MTGNTNSGLSLSAFLETVVINVSNNIGKIISPTVTLSYSGLTKEFTKFPVIEKIPEGTDYTISFSNIDHYLTPSTITGKAISGLTRNYNGEYKACLLTVNSNLSCSVTVTSPSFTAVMGNNDTVQLVWGETATIAFSDIDGYITPENITVTANQSAISIEGMYEEVVLEVKIMNLDGELYNVSSWTEGRNATGVYFNDGLGHEFIIAPDEWLTENGNTDGSWLFQKTSAIGGEGILLSNIVTTTNLDTALNDFSGENNTSELIKQLVGTKDPNYSIYNYVGSPAAEYCRAYRRGCKEAGQWYLPSLGELNLMVENKDKINEALLAIEGESLSSNSWTRSSTQYNNSVMWCYTWLSNAHSNPNKFLYGGIRPICKFQDRVGQTCACYVSFSYGGSSISDSSYPVLYLKFNYGMTWEDLCKEEEEEVSSYIWVRSNQSVCGGANGAEIHYKDHSNNEIWIKGSDKVVPGEYYYCISRGPA